MTACSGEGEPEAEPCAVLADNLATALGETLAAENRAGGISAAVITPECGLWEDAVGTIGSDEPLTPEHLLRVGSVTKTFVAATVLSLVADGALALDDTLDTWGFDIPDADVITVRQLLNHTSGIYNYTDQEFLEAAFNNPTLAYAPQDIVDLAIEHPPLFAAGSGWSYSNTNYILLGMLIEAVTGNPAAAEIRARILVPQGLVHTFSDGDETGTGTLATGFGPNGEDHTYALHPSAAGAAGNMVGTARDMATWAQALYSGQVLPQQQFDDMLEFIETDEIPGSAYGLGVISHAASLFGTQLIGHSGGIFGFVTEMYYLPDVDSTVVAIVNSEAGDSIAALAALVDQIIQIIPQP